MKNVLKNKWLLIILTLVVGGLMGWLIKPTSNEPLIQEVDHQHELTSNQIWTCSMHPQIRKNEPGNCPICGMDLIPLSTDNGNDENPEAIKMSPTAMQLANVQTALVGRGNAIKQIRLTGKITTDERVVFSQTSHVSGRIEQLAVNYTGEVVRKGQAIATLYSPELVTAQEELFIALESRDAQPELMKAAKEKLKNWKLNEKQIELLMKSGKTTDQFSVLSDLNGIVIQIMANKGDYIKQGGVFYKVADLAKLWVLLDVHESDLAWVKEGDQVNFSVKAFPNENFTGKISFIDPIIDPKTRVAQARIEIDNSNQKFKPEMLVSATIESELRLNKDAIIVPKSAVMWTGERSVVYVKTTAERGMHFIMREVELGASLGSTYIIQNGLVEGEEIAVNGTFSIDAAAQLAGKPSMMNPEGGQMNMGHNHGGENMKMDDNQKKTTVKMSNESVKVDQKAKNALTPIFENYFELKNALTQDNFLEANKAAQELQNSLAKVDMKLFKGNAHQAWMDFSKDFQIELEKANKAEEIDQIRDSFISISKTIIELNETFKPLNYIVYIQYCPMAKNNKGADWLSKEEEIKNPYFGSSMLGCGELKSTVK